MERERILYSDEERFKQAIDERNKLWISIIDDSEVNNITKNKIKQLLLELKNDPHKKWGSLDNAVYGTISSMLTIVNQDDKKSEAKALFENIRDDIWALFKEIKNEA